jgi:catechol 2,3-dioxygenase-like lactoylglutathione lyase family enzyme
VSDQPAVPAGGIQGVVYVVDLERMTSFYADVLGLEVVEHDPGDVATLESGDVVLSLVRMPDEWAAAVEVGDPPTRREDVALKMSFPVASIAAARAAAAAAGGLVDDPSTEWSFRGNVVCHGHDPEGNVISLRAPAP